MSANKKFPWFLMIISWVLCLMFLIYAVVQRTAAIKQQELALEIAKENNLLVMRAEEAKMQAAANAEEARRALERCEQKQKKK
jgi:hypothetical protein